MRLLYYCLGTSNVPRSFEQCWSWCEKWLPFSKKFHAIGIAGPFVGLSGKTPNSMCFEGKIMTSPITIICYACSLMGYWAGLFLDDDKAELIAGANTMLKITLKLVGKKMGTKKRDLLKDTKNGDQDK